MDNRIDNLFKHSTGIYHIPGLGPQWASLERRMRAKSRKPYFLYMGIGVILCASGILMVFRYQAGIGNNDYYSQNSVEQNYRHDNDNNNAHNNGSLGSILMEPGKESGNNKPGNINTGNTTVQAEGNYANSVRSNIDILTLSRDLPLNNAFTSNNSQGQGIVKLFHLKKYRPVGTDPGLVMKDKIKTPAVHLNLKIYKPFILSIYFNLTPSIIHSQDILTADNRTHKNYSGYRMDGEKMISAINLGLGIQFSPFKKLSIYSGFMVEERMERVDYNFRRNNVPVVDASTGEIFGYVILPDSIAEEVNYTNNNIYRYSGVPVNIKYQLYNKGRFVMGINIGGSYLKQTDMKGKTINSATLRLENLSAANSTQLESMFNSGFGFDFNYLVAPKLMLSVLPNYITQVSKNTHSTKARQACINMNIQYKLF